MSGIALTLIIILSLFIYFFAKVIMNKFIEKINEKNEQIAELKEILKSKDIEVNNIKENKENDFIDKIIESSEKYNKKYEKEQNRKKYFENVKKGKDYEEYLERYFNEKGYLVDNRSKRKGRKDNGIDFFLKKDNIYTLVQCKNFAPTTIIKQDMIRKFNGDCLNFVINNNLENDKVKFKFVVPSKKSLHNGAIYYFRDESNKCRYEIIEFEKENITPGETN